jgi:copper chaperone NosL
MSKSILIIAASLLLLMYLFPIWSITLQAPQYPEGLGMYIWVDNITGQKPHDLTNINLVNHYIGMKEIHPDSFPELHYMPWIVLFLVVFGLVAAFQRSNRMLLAWLIIFGLLAVVGLADFYRWNYNYGHDLDLAHAAIKIPGQAYQPPLFGKKTLLNFVAYSYPALGGIAAFLSFLLGSAAWLISIKKGK